jgi:hypothetical protein
VRARRVVCAVAWALLALFSCSCPARAETRGAEPLRVDFSYRAPADCPTEQRALELLRARGRAIERAPAGSGAIRVSMDLARDAGGVRGVLSVTRAGAAPEQRTVVGTSCADAVAALAFTAALSLDPEGTLTLDAGAAPGGAEAEESRPPGVDVEPAPSAPVEQERSPRFALAGLASVQSLVEGRTHLGFGVGAALGRDSRRVLLPLELAAELQVLLDPGAQPSPGIGTAFALGRLAYCPLRVGAEVALLLCPVAALGAVRAESQGVEEPEVSTRFYASLGALVRLRARLGPHLELGVTPTLEVPLTERAFAIEPGPEVLARTVGFSFGVGFGVGWRF